MIDKREALLPGKDLRLAVPLSVRLRCIFTKPYGHGWKSLEYPWGFCPYCKHLRYGGE